MSLPLQIKGLLHAIQDKAGIDKQREVAKRFLSSNGYIAVATDKWHLSLPDDRCVRRCNSNSNPMRPAGGIDDLFSGPMNVCGHCADYLVVYLEGKLRELSAPAVVVQPLAPMVQPPAPMVQPVPMVQFVDSPPMVQSPPPAAMRSTAKAVTFSPTVVAYPALPQAPIEPASEDADFLRQVAARKEAERKAAEERLAAIALYQAENEAHTTMIERSKLLDDALVARMRTAFEMGQLPFIQFESVVKRVAKAVEEAKEKKEAANAAHILRAQELCHVDQNAQYKQMERYLGYSWFRLLLEKVYKVMPSFVSLLGMLFAMLVMVLFFAGVVTVNVEAMPRLLKLPFELVWHPAVAIFKVLFGPVLG